MFLFNRTCSGGERGGEKNQSIGYNVSDRSSPPPPMMRFNEEHGLINLIPVVEASLHNEKRQNTEGGRGEGEGEGGYRNGNFSNKNVITSERKFDRWIQLLFFFPLPLKKLEFQLGSRFCRISVFPLFWGFSFLSLFEQTVKTIGRGFGEIAILKHFEYSREGN